MNYYQLNEDEKKQIRIFYLQHKFSIMDIGRKMGLGKSIVGTFLKKSGITRTHDQARKIKNVKVNESYKKGILTKDQRETLTRLKNEAS